MRRDFHRELESLETSVVGLAELVAEAIRGASAGLLNADLRAAESVVSGDDVIDQIYADVESRAMRLLARQQPVGRGLCTLITALRMVQEIERMGDLALHIAKVARRRYPAIAILEPACPALTEMARLATAFATGCAAAVAEHDLTAALALDKDDDRIDDLHRQLFAVVLGPNWTHTMEQAIDVTLCGRYCERFCDHAITVAKHAAFVVTGSHSPLTKTSAVFCR